MDATYDNLAKGLETKLNGPQYWIAIAGGPGSGKTTVADAVADRLNQMDPNSTLVIPMDGWHIPQKQLIATQGPQAMKRRGAPWTIDADKCIHDLQQAKQKETAQLPIYDRTISDPVPNGVTLLASHKIVLVEGLYLLWKTDPKWAPAFDLFDEHWWVECPTQEIQIERLIHRAMQTWSEQKTKDWGEGREGARRKAEANDIANMKLIAHCRDFAERVIVSE